MTSEDHELLVDEIDKGKRRDRRIVTSLAVMLVAAIAVLGSVGFTVYAGRTAVLDRLELNARQNNCRDQVRDALLTNGVQIITRYLADQRVSEDDPQVVLFLRAAQVDAQQVCNTDDPPSNPLDG